MTRPFAALAALAILLTAPAMAQDAAPLSLTIYQGEGALVRDQRSFNLPGAPGELLWEGLSPLLQPETARLRTLQGPPLSVSSRSFALSPLSAQSLLDAHRGRNVFIREGAVTEQGTLLSTDNPAIVSLGGKLRLVPHDRLAFDRLPEGLPMLPAMSLRHASDKPGSRQLELSYLSGGFSWQADHQLDLGAQTMDLQTWATIANSSGLDLTDARVQLASGGLQRPAPMPRPMMAKGGVAMAEAAMPPDLGRREMAGMQIYGLDRAITLASGQALQVAMVSLPAHPVRTLLVVQPQSLPFAGRQGVPEGKAIRRLTFEAAKPLPAGPVRVFQSGELIGEAPIDHVPQGRPVRLDIGPDLQVSVERLQTDARQLQPNGGFEQAWTLTLHNAKSEPVTVQVREPLAPNATIVQASQPQRVEQGEAVWDIRLAAQGKAELTYRIRQGP